MNRIFFFQNQSSQFNVKQINHIVYIYILIPYSGLFKLYSKINIRNMLKIRFFNKIRFLIAFCQIKSTYSEFARRELSIGALIVHNFFLFFVNIWVPIESSRRENSEYVLFI